MQTTTETRSPSPLGVALFLYLLGIVLVVTLLPFRFQWPHHPHIVWNDGLFGFVTNICLFLPLGFLYRQSRDGENDGWCLRVLALGLLLSLGIEVTQLFLRGRYSSLLDVLANGMGAWIGALLHERVKQRLQERLVGQLALELPLMNLFYLLVPLLWLNGVATGNDVSRLWLMPLLGLCGSSILAAVWVHRLRPAEVFSANTLAVVAALWFAVGAAPGFAKRPVLLALCSLGIALAVRLQVTVPWFTGSPGRRFERPALRRVWLPYATYVCLVALWPWPWIPVPWQASLGFADVADVPGVIPTLRVIEYIAAFTLLGYMLAEHRGRQEEPRRRSVQWLLVWGIAAGGLLELMRGFHPQHVASLTHLAVAIGAMLYGGLIYWLQLADIERLLAPIAPSTVEAKVHTP